MKRLCVPSNDVAMTSAACTTKMDEIAEIWEVLPQKGYLNDPIDVEIELGENSDVINIEY